MDEILSINTPPSDTVVLPTDSPGTTDDRAPLICSTECCRNKEQEENSPPCSPSNSRSSYKYEELSHKLKVQCPTCSGKGKLTQSQADSMVALIPIRDKRLKPRKTKLYLGITVVVCLLCIFLIAFFLLPRNVNLSIVQIETTEIYMPGISTDIPYIDVKITYEVTNENYFDASVKNLNTDISWNKFILNTSWSGTDFSAKGRTKTNHTEITRQVFSGTLIKSKVQLVCATGWNWNLLEKFVSTASVSYLSRTEEISYTNYGYVDCHNTSSLTIFDKRKHPKLTTRSPDKHTFIIND